jgi:hypothetical protein
LAGGSEGDIESPHPAQTTSVLMRKTRANMMAV